ncbi:universal stress protein [Streptomyces sp. NRRL S-87]|uniref:universal stress protein n=1 Tax=Streptomyces sp. NRRL S-87 TaxID=1463920 RepID=UPI0004BFD74A|nr:universal stress protein [Streptomyces sp. NRRL S-87]
MRVVVGVSGTPHGATALHRAADEARVRGADLWAVLAWKLPGHDPDRRETWRSTAVARLREILDEAFGPAGPGVPLAGLTALGSPGPVLVDVAQAPDDILVVGTGTHRGLRRMLAPSTARYCLTRAACPVLVVPPSPLEAALEAVRRRNARGLPLDARELGAVRP